MKLRDVVAVIFAVATAGALTVVVVSNRLNARHAAELAAQQAASQQEKAELEMALESARAASRFAAAPAASAPAATLAKATPAEIVARLRALKSVPGTRPSRFARQAIHDFEELIAAGPAALPAIHEFFARNEDMDFDPPNQGRGGRSGSVPNDFILPPSLRFGFFDVVKQIGGADGEKLLAETLGTTGRGVELAWLARALQESAPNKYRDVALAAARELLARPPVANSGSPLDQNDREHLFSVLTMYGDTSFVSAAQAQLVQADGALDRSALNYLQQSLGAQAVAIAAQTYQNPLLLTNAAAKEPLARLALNFVGADVQANEFYQQAINDPVLTKSHRKNLIEDLNEDGLNFRNLSASDLPLIQNRIALIEQLAPNASDPVNAAAFKEAHKDLLNMRKRITSPPNPGP